MAQQLLNALFKGSIYALFALGYTLVFGVLDILNLAHQAVFMLCAFIAWTLVAGLHLPMLAALPAAVLAGGIIGIGLDQMAFRPLRARAETRIASLISSLAAASIFTSIAQGLWGSDVRVFPEGSVQAGFVGVRGARLQILQLAIIGLSIAVMAALTWMLERTRLGRQIRATAENPLAARVLGIHVDRVIGACFFLSSALGGLAGVLFGLALNNVSHMMGGSIQLKGLAVIVLGGMGSVPGAVAAGYAIALAEVFTVATVGSSYSDAVPYAVLFLVLLVRPRGLFGRAAARVA